MTCIEEIEKEIYDIIKQALTSYRLSNYVDEDGNAYPLLDHLSIPGENINTGKDEIDFMVDHIAHKLSPFIVTENNESKEKICKLEKTLKNEQNYTLLLLNRFKNL